jgi:acetyl-CoA C-acetyltransferase
MTPSGRTPVLVGVGFASQDLDEPGAGSDVRELMAAAATAAGEDAGNVSVLREVRRILLPRGTWELTAPGGHVARQIGAAEAHCVRAALGIPQQSLVNDALGSIMRGDVDAAMVVGGEARKRDVVARRGGVDLPPVDESDLAPDEEWPLDRVSELMADAERDARVVLPIQQYALMENALGHAEGRTLEQLRDDVSRLYEAWDAVAAKNPRAAFGAGRSAELLRTPSERNRPIAFPYNKWHVTQMNVDQSVALLFCSFDRARELGIEPERCVFPHVSVESTLAVSLSCRRAMHAWPAMGELGKAAAARLGRPLTDIEHVELYSCFPVAVRVQQRELGLAVDGVQTITGGMAFAGGPLNSFVLHEIGEMAVHLREHPGQLGLVGAVSGLLTKPGLSAWSTAPPEEAPLVADLRDRAAAATETVESVAGYEGAATIATYTVEYEGMTATKVDVIADTPDGTRCVAVSDDAELAAKATRESIIGAPIQVNGTTFVV